MAFELIRGTRYLDLELGKEGGDPQRKNLTEARATRKHSYQERRKRATHWIQQSIKCYYTIQSSYIGCTRVNRPLGTWKTTLCRDLASEHRT